MNQTENTIIFKNFAGNPACPCKRTACERHGNCAECREHHITVKHFAVYCDRHPKKTKTNTKNKDLTSPKRQD
jgi:hypothetical protein